MDVTRRILGEGPSKAKASTAEQDYWVTSGDWFNTSPLGDVFVKIKALKQLGCIISDTQVIRASRALQASYRFLTKQKRGRPTDVHILVRAPRGRHDELETQFQKLFSRSGYDLFDVDDGHNAVTTATKSLGLTDEEADGAINVDFKFLGLPIW